MTAAVRLRAPAITSTLRSGDEVPPGQPARYLNDAGYVRLRWKTAPNTYVEVYEHRLVAGMPADELDVHHLDHVKTNNSRGNLRILTKAEHGRLHALETPQVYKGPKRQPLSQYPRCVLGCDRPAQCLDRTICLMHYKRWKRTGSTDRG